jgi:outer membrane biosynthesis protein TonB
MQHDGHLRYYFIFSVFIHVIIFLLIYYFFIQKKVSFRTEENKIVNVKLVKTPPKSAKNVSNEGQIAKPKTISGFKNIIQSRPKLSQATPVRDGMTKKIATYQHSKSHHSTQKFTKNFTAAAQLYDSENDLNEPVMEFAQDDGLTFSDGEARKLVEYDIQAIKALNLISDQECTLLLSVNESGYITNIEIIKSTNDQLLDQTITSIIGNWKFEAGSSLQKAMLKLKYFIK